MRRPLYGGRGVPDTDVSAGPTAAVALLAVTALLAAAVPLVAAAVTGGVAVAVGRRLPVTLRSRLSGRRGRRLCLPGTRACLEI